MVSRLSWISWAVIPWKRYSGGYVQQPKIRKIRHVFLLSSPAHYTYPNQAFTKEEASPVNLGTLETSNQRTIYKYIHEGGLQSCQLVMGLTVLQTGSVWNTMPAHTHDRRMEAYCYFDIPENHGVLHLMGEPTQTRHLWVANHQAIISPPWSIHSGCGTSSYSFIWGMAGENKDFRTDGCTCYTFFTITITTN